MHQNQRRPGTCALIMHARARNIHPALCHIRAGGQSCARRKFPIRLLDTKILLNLRQLFPHRQSLLD